MGDRALKLPSWLADSAEQFSRDLEGRGFAALGDDLVRPPRCPRCDGPTRRVDGLHAVCEVCGLPHASLEEAWSTGGFMPLGVILGVAMNALWLRQARGASKEPPPAAAPIPPRAPRVRGKRR